jgi:hypothetical protein
LLLRLSTSAVLLRLRMCLLLGLWLSTAAVLLLPLRLRLQGKPSRPMPASGAGLPRGVPTRPGWLLLLLLLALAVLLLLLLLLLVLVYVQSSHSCSPTQPSALSEPLPWFCRDGAFTLSAVLKVATDRPSKALTAAVGEDARRTGKPSASNCRATIQLLRAPGRPLGPVTSRISCAAFPASIDPDAALLALRPGLATSQYMPWTLPFFAASSAATTCSTDCMSWRAAK